MTNQKREILIEFEEILVVRGANRPVLTWCEECGERVPMLGPELAARFAQVTARTLFRWVETGRLHFIEIRGGALLICRNSLGAAANRLIEAQIDRPALAADARQLPATLEAHQLIEGEILKT